MSARKYVNTKLTTHLLLSKRSEVSGDGASNSSKALTESRPLPR